MANATLNEYLLIEDAVNDALTVGERQMIEAMDHQTRDSVSKFLTVLKGEMDRLDALPQMPWHETVLDSSSLTMARSAARSCLSEIGFNLAEWERSEGYAA